MKISTKIECGIIALIDIALFSDDDKVVKVHAISSRNNISAKYLEQIIPLLKQAGIIKSVKGANGGYTLSRSSAEITLYEIVNALDNTLLAPSEFDDRFGLSALSAIDECLWAPITESLCKISKDLSLKALSERYSEKLTEGTEPMYYI